MFRQRSAILRVIFRTKAYKTNKPVPKQLGVYYLSWIILYYVHWIVDIGLLINEKFTTMQNEATVAYPTYYSTVSLKSLRTNHENTSATISDVPIDIWAEHRPNKNPEFYRYTSLLDLFFFIVCQSYKCVVFQNSQS
jgi:hypothetical protein